MISEILLVITVFSTILLMFLLLKMRKEKKVEGVKKIDDSEIIVSQLEEPAIKVQKIRKNEINPLKIVIILMVIILLISVVSISGYYVLDQSYNESLIEKQSLENELNNTQKNLDNLTLQSVSLEDELFQNEASLAENFSDVKILKSGDIYHLHDPTWNEVCDFFINNNEKDIQKMIDKAKNQGMRCAYVNVAIEDGAFVLIGFNTIDDNMVYLEPRSHYLVNPVVGLNYYDCVNDQPYGPSNPEDKDKITEILIIW